MKRNRQVFITILSLLLLLVIHHVSADVVSAKYADGSYDVTYEVLRADNDSASIADGYFVKPATLIVEGSNSYIQLTVKSSDMVKSLTGPYGKANLVSENKSANTKVYKFQINDVTKPVEMGMHIVVDVEEIQYDTTHKARFVFNTDEVKEGTASAGKTGGADNGSPSTTEDNPKTGDETPIVLFAVLLLGSGLLIARHFIVNKQNKKGEV